VIHLGIAATIVGSMMFLAQIVKELGPSNLMNGFISAIPYVLGTVGVIAWEYLGDRMGERRWTCLRTCGQRASRRDRSLMAARRRGPMRSILEEY
jgi:MFS transporter, ACS family, tartrate transporter